MEDSDAVMTRGVLATKAGVNSETIRYYEQVSLLPQPARSPGGHRIYGGEGLRRLRFIRRARELGFSLNQIRDLLNLVDEERLTCAAVLERATDHLQDVKARIADLKRMERTLKSIMDQCSGDSRPECPIIDALLR